MATVYSSLFNSDFKAFMTYTTETTATAYKVTVTNAGVYIDCSWANYPWKTTMTATGYDSRSASVGTTYWTKGNHGVLTADKTYSWERKTSAYTVTIKVTTKKNVSGGGSGSKSVTFTVPALAKYTVSYNANGGSGAPSAQTKYYGKTLTLSSTKPTRSGYTFVGWGTSTTDTSADYSAGGSYTANASDTLYAIWKKTITLSYNNNGGSGAPDSQNAIVYNATTSKTFTIPSATMERSGYAFLGWSKSSTATSASYSAGSSITLSASDTLYAVWRLNNFTVKYNANGGTGAPASQTKVYGTDLKLSTTIPTRKYYAFKGWATSASGSVVYNAGGIYTANAAITLYAVWEVTYIIPRITNISITRCDVNGDSLDDGTYALVKFNWATDVEATAAMIQWKVSTDTSYGNSESVTISGQSGSVSQVVGDGNLSTESAYNFKIVVTDTTDTNYALKTLSATLFPIDLLAGGKGVSLGEPAKEEGFNVNMVSKFKQLIHFINGYGIQTYLADGITSVPMLYTSSNNNLIVGHTSGINYLYLRTKNFDIIFSPPDSGSTAAGYFIPGPDNEVTLGTTVHRWTRLYAGNSSISTSDKRTKENIKHLKKAMKKKKKDDGTIEEIRDVYSELFDRLDPVEYNFIDGEQRKDFGLIAQDVLEVMKDLGMEEDELDLVHHDTWIDEETGEEKDAYGIAYENLIPVLIHEVQKLKGVNNEG